MDHARSGGTALAEEALSTLDGAGADSDFEWHGGVYFDDLDPMGMLHNARYFVLVERAEAAFHRSRGREWEANPTANPDQFYAVREQSIDYLRPVVGTGDVSVRMWLERLGETSATLRFLVTSGGNIHADARRSIVKVDPATMQPAPWTAPMRESFLEIARGGAIANSAPAEPSVGTARHVTLSSVEVNGSRIAFRVGGPPEAGNIVLLHGFPGSSATFDRLVERLARSHRVIAPDYPGFGLSDIPESPSTFDALAETMTMFLDALDVDRYALYMFDFGGPVGMRIAAARPTSVTGLVFQNANIYEEGLGVGFEGLRGYWASPEAVGPKLRAGLLTEAGVRAQHLAGASHPDAIPAAAWEAAAAELSDPRRQQVVLDLLLDYQHNLARYGDWQAWLKDHRLPVLAVWGAGDPIFTTVGATSLRHEVPDADVVLIDAGHFAALEAADEIGAAVASFLESGPVQQRRRGR